MTVAPHPTRPLRIISADRAAIAFSAPAGADHLPDANASQGLGLHLPQDLHQITAVAIGILIARRRCTPQQALAKLIDLATKTDRSVLDIADHLIAHYARPESQAAAPKKSDQLVSAELSTVT